ncbi:helix-turn-helix domain-containing protein [Aureibaculum sp. A20]|uniref:Helix-turn-helix domain-containing protein n=1 Tax=Aureibaculum flavum TaxID=2795986 RepID=A0ABS0WP88_9FLAO|nr:AraC family transcriptional regulator [Aureibaculum flavum]MBJ2173804.1 helix-turn-helix domain-containing protein [Aureibaculum flavum]
MKFSLNIVLILIVFIFFNLSNGHAQDLKDYKKEYEMLQDSVSKHTSSNKRLAVDFEKRLLQLVEKNNDTTEMIILLHRLGSNSQVIAEFEQSIGYFQKELRLISKYDISRDSIKFKGFTEIEILAQLGQNYKLLGQYDKAFKTYDKCLRIAERDNLEFYKAVMPAIIADLDFTVGDYKEALIKNKKSFSALNKVTDIDKNIIVHNRSSIALKLSEIYLKLNEKDSAIWILNDDVLEQLDSIGRFEMRVIAQRGKIYLKKEEFQKALENLKEAESMAYKYDSVLAPAIVYYDLAETYFKINENEKAIHTLEEGIAVVKPRVKETSLTEDYKLLAKIYKASGNLEKSNVYYEKYILNQTALEKSKDTITSAFHTQEVSNLEKEKSTQKNTFYLYMSIGLGLLVLLITFIIYLIKEKKKNTEKFNVLLAKFSQQEKPTFEIIDTKDKVLEEKISAEVNEETTYLILAGLQSLKEQEYFLRQDCNSYNVAKKIKTNTSYLSKVINSHFEKNFNTYINDLRINYAVLRLKNDSRFRSFSVQSIAEEIGYKSADSFSKYFKLRTGLNPSFYIKELNSLS